METEEILVAIQKAAETIATPNWAAILSVVISLLAVVVAGFVAWRQYGITKMQNDISQKQAEIAEQQNRIALFEKRYELYRIISDCRFLSLFLLESAKKQSDIYTIVALAFNIDVNETPVQRNTVWPHISAKVDKLKQSDFLFSKNISIYINRLSVSLLMLMAPDILHINDKKFDTLKGKYNKAVRELLEAKVLEEIEAQLQLL